jgi:hypothetical protein
MIGAGGGPATTPVPEQEEMHVDDAAGTGMDRRALLGVGIAGGAAALAGGVLGVPGAAATVAATEAGSMEPDGRALPPAVPGAQMLGIGAQAFTTFGVGGPTPARVDLDAAKGMYCNAEGQGLWGSFRVPPGSHIVRIDVYGYVGAGDTQTWWLRMTDPSLFQTYQPANANLTRPTAGPVNGTINLNQVVTAGYDFAVVAESGPSGPWVRGAVVQYQRPFGDFVAIPPKRVHDSRPAKIIAGTEREISVATQVGTGATVVPEGAKAVAVNLTITDTEGSGWLSLRPFGQPATGTSSVNWSGNGQVDANEMPVQLGGDRKLIVRAGGSGAPRTNFILDVVGYYL